VGDILHESAVLIERGLEPMVVLGREESGVFVVRAHLLAYGQLEPPGYVSVDRVEVDPAEQNEV
jgi:hypothetical protein